jgi:hypothetical protein
MKGWIDGLREVRPIKTRQLTQANGTYGKKILNNYKVEPIQFLSKSPPMNTLRMAWKGQEKPRCISSGDSGLRESGS